MMSQNKSVRFGIVGCGMISHYHADAIGAVENAELVGACSRSRESAEAFCGKYGIRCFESYEQMLASSDITAVSICTPSGDHARQILMALRAGKDVVVEKPMCISLADADEVIRLAEETGKKVCVISQLRFSDAIQEIRRAIREGLLGKVYSVALTMRYFRSQAYYDQAGWRGTWAMDGGGVLMNQGIHGIDMLCYLFGPAEEVGAYAATLGRDIEVEDTAVAAVKFESGVLATIDASTCCAPGFPRKMVISGERGTIVTEDDNIVLWTLPEPCGMTVGTVSANSGASDPRGITWANHARQFEDFVDSVLNDRAPVSDQREGRLPLELILGVYESSREGKFVKLTH